MKYIELDEFVAATNAQILSQNYTRFSNLSTDSRGVKAGEMFLALIGEAFDGHHFIGQAIESGASAVVTHEPIDADFLQKTTVIYVKDTLKALQDFAKFRREKSSALVVGITGSNGKTTSKEFCHAVVSPEKKTHYNQGSFNNHWGVPLTLLAEPEGTEVTIAEMGMNHEGEIRALCEFAKPDIVVCTTVGRAHLGHFKNVEQIAAAKSEIYEHAETCIFNLDNPYTQKMYQDFAPRKKRVITFSSKDEKADVFFKIKHVSMSQLEIEGTINGVRGAAIVQVFGAHNVTNLMVAASVGVAVGLSPQQVWKNLTLCRTNWGRNQLVKTKIGVDILFDGYNANPDSMNALLDNFVWIETRGKKYAVFGEMLEMGDQAFQVHFELGQKVAQTGFEKIWFIGASASAFTAGYESVKLPNNLFISNTYEDKLANDMASVLKDGDVVLVKGSRGMKLERFVMFCQPIDFKKN